MVPGSIHCDGSAFLGPGLSSCLRRPSSLAILASPETHPQGLSRATRSSGTGSSTQDAEDQTGEHRPRCFLHRTQDRLQPNRKKRKFFGHSLSRRSHSGNKQPYRQLQASQTCRHGNRQRSHRNVPIKTRSSQPEGVLVFHCYPQSMDTDAVRLSRQNCQWPP